MNPELQTAMISERDVLESLTPDQLADYITDCGTQVSALEKSMNIASDVLDGYGTTVEDILKEREKQNGKT